MTASSQAPWTRALVTGASAGIGRALAVELARRGVHLVVVARDETALKELAGELEGAHGIEVEVLAADLGQPEPLARVADRLGASPSIDLLVNNAAIGTFGAFASADIETEMKQVDINVTAPLRLTRAALGPMVANGRGGIVAISSLDGIMPAPFHAVYAATKAFVNSFFEGLHQELAGTAVTVTTVMPGFVKTGFTERAGVDGVLEEVPGFLMLSPEQVASDALDAAASGKAMEVPGAVYKVYAPLVDALPRGMRRRLSSRLLPHRESKGRKDGNAG